MAEGLTSTAALSRLATDRVADDVQSLPPLPKSAAFERDLVAMMPSLRGFSRGLCGRHGIAEDMVQETMVKAWRARDRFVAGTNLKAWLFTILRNEFYSHLRRAWREMPWDERLGELIPTPADEQTFAMELSDCARALNALPRRQREAVLLTGAGGLTYRASADLLETPIGNVKSRTARGRSKLTKMLEGEMSLPQRSSTRAPSGMENIVALLATLESESTNRSVRA